MAEQGAAGLGQREPAAAERGRPGLSAAAPGQRHGQLQPVALLAMAQEPVEEAALLATPMESSCRTQFCIAKPSTHICASRMSKHTHISQIAIVSK